MQKATYYDSSAIYGGYPYQGANGFTYNANHQQYPPPSALVESEYHRPACSLQSPDSSVVRHKANDINESCMRTIGSQGGQAQGLPESQQPPPQPQQQQAPPPSSQQPQQPSQPTVPSAPSSSQPPPSVSPPQNASSNPAPTKSPMLNSPTMSKQIFPWMKESRQNTKQKNSSSSSGNHDWHGEGWYSPASLSPQVLLVQTVSSFPPSSPPWSRTYLAERGTQDCISTPMLWCSPHPLAWVSSINFSGFFSQGSGSLSERNETEPRMPTFPFPRIMVVVSIALPRVQE